MKIPKEKLIKNQNLKGYLRDINLRQKTQPFLNSPLAYNATKIANVKRSN